MKPATWPDTVDHETVSSQLSWQTALVHTVRSLQQGSCCESGSNSPYCVDIRPSANQYPTNHTYQKTQVHPHQPEPEIGDSFEITAGRLPAAVKAGTPGLAYLGRHLASASRDAFSISSSSSSSSSSRSSSSSSNMS